LRHGQVGKAAIASERQIVSDAAVVTWQGPGEAAIASVLVYC